MAGHGHEPAGHGHTGDVGEDYNIGTIVTVAIVGCLALFLTIIWLRALFARAERWEWERKTVAAPFVELEDLRAAQQVKLNSWEWSDPAKDCVTVPVNLAASRVLLDLQREQLLQAEAARAAEGLAQPGTAQGDTVPAQSATVIEPGNGAGEAGEHVDNTGAEAEQTAAGAAESGH